VEVVSANKVAEAGRRRERGGRSARREMRSHGAEGLGRAYIVRNIPT
jgi:trimethylamine--corrinoid protein Co-methyltransferase